MDDDDLYDAVYFADNIVKFTKKLQTVNSRYNINKNSQSTNSNVKKELDLDEEDSFQEITPPVKDDSSMIDNTHQFEGTTSGIVNESDSDDLLDTPSATRKDSSQNNRSGEKIDTSLNDAFDDEYGDDSDFEFDDEELECIAAAEKEDISPTTTTGMISPETGNDDDDENDGAEDDDDLINQPSDIQYLDVLKQYFGYAKFRPMQWRIINSVLNDKRDNCVVMATGYGKSLCFQFPSVFTKRVSIVISPLISLMEDQVLSLSAANIPACFLGSAQENGAQIRSDIMKGHFRLIYLTPEYISSGVEFISKIDEKVGIDLVAIDEAHCVSQWGHDFRSAYRNLGKIRKALAQVPILALTATATPSVVDDICKSLRLKNPQKICTGFDRPNLYLSVSMKNNCIDDFKGLMTTNNGGRTYEFEGQTIVYCGTKKSAEDVEYNLKMLGVKCSLYHAGLSMAKRKEAHKQFVSDQIQAVVATVAFGMGIDKPDVRKVIHYGAPKDIESYYQEIGRGGRDGLPSACHAFYSNQDFNINKFLLKDMTNETFRKHKTDMIQKMQNYLATTKCRRIALLKHFDDKVKLESREKENCCDNCRRRHQMSVASAAGLSCGRNNLIHEDQQDYTKEVKILLSSIVTTGERFGLAVPVLFIRGSYSQKLSANYQRHSDFGSGKYKSEKWWKAFARQIISENLLQEKAISGSFGCTIELTYEGRKILDKCGTPSFKYKLEPNLELQQLEAAAVKPEIAIAPKILPTVSSSSWISAQDGKGSMNQNQTKNIEIDPRDSKLQRVLYANLLALRSTLSDQSGLPAFSLFSNKTLVDAARCRPTTMDNFLKIEDVAIEKAQRYGNQFIECIKEYCKAEGWETDRLPGADVLNARVDINIQHGLSKLKECYKRTYRTFEQQGQSLESTALDIGLQTSTVINHLCEAIKVGLPINIKRLGVTDEVEKLITTTIRKPPINSDISRLRPIKDELPEDISYNQIRVVITILQRRYEGADIQQNNSPASQSTSDTSDSSNRESQSDGSTGNQKRKLPPWLTKAPSIGSKASNKKLKKNSLFH